MGPGWKTYLVWLSVAVSAVSFALAAMQAGAVWLIPATFGAPGVAVLLWRAARRVLTWRHRVTHFLDVERERGELRSRVETMESAAESHVAQRRSSWGAGVIEGIKRYHGAVLGGAVKTMPDFRHTVVSGGNITVIAAPMDEIDIQPHCRFTVVSDATGAPLGVLAVTEVSPDRRLTMVCVEELDPEYWADVRKRRADEQGPLKDVHLETYSQFKHHPLPMTGAATDMEGES